MRIIIHSQPPKLIKAEGTPRVEVLAEESKIEVESKLLQGDTTLRCDYRFDGNGNDARWNFAPFQAPGYAPGHEGLALNIEPGEFATGPSNIFEGAGNNLTIAFWVKLNPDNEPGAVAFEIESEEKRLSIIPADAGAGRPRLQISGLLTLISPVITNTAPTGEFFLIVLRRQLNTLRLDTLGTTSIAMAGFLNLPVSFNTLSPANFWLGKSISTDAKFSGQIDGLRIWNRYLSDAEVAALG